MQSYCSQASNFPSALNSPRYCLSIFFFSFSFSGFTIYRRELLYPFYGSLCSILVKNEGFCFCFFFFFTPWMDSILLDPFGSLSRESLRALCFHFNLSGFMSSFFLLSFHEFISFTCSLSLSLPFLVLGIFI